MKYNGLTGPFCYWQNLGPFCFIRILHFDYTRHQNGPDGLNGGIARSSQWALLRKRQKNKTLSTGKKSQFSFWPGSQCSTASLSEDHKNRQIYCQHWIKHINKWHLLVQQQLQVSKSNLQFQKEWTSRPWHFLLKINIFCKLKFSLVLLGIVKTETCTRWHFNFSFSSYIKNPINEFCLKNCHSIFIISVLNNRHCFHQHASSVLFKKEIWADRSNPLSLKRLWLVSIKTLKSVHMVVKTFGTFKLANLQGTHPHPF